MGTYHTAQICLMGHAINSSADRYTELNEKFCSKCGAETISACPHCNAPIRGYYEVPGYVDLSGSYRKPRFCHECGKAFPWTDSALKAAKDYASEIEDISPEDRELLVQSIGEVVRETPQTEVASMRIKRILRGAGSVVADGLKRILVDVVSDTARKTLELD